MRSGLLFRGALQVEGEETLKDLVVGEVVGPAVGVEDGAIELAVGEVEAGRVFLGESGMPDQAAEVEEMLLSGRSLLEFDLAPLGYEFLGRERRSHSSPPLNLLS